MFPEIVKRIGLLLLLVVLQALIFGRMHLFGYATPLLYTYFIITYPRNISRWLGLLMAFTLGLLVDIFMNTPGMAAASLTLIAFIQPVVLELFLDRESEEDLKPSVKTLGWLKYCAYAFFLLFVYSLVFFALEMFAFSNILQWLFCALASFALTCIFIVVIEIARR